MYSALHYNYKELFAAISDFNEHLLHAKTVSITMVKNNCSQTRRLLYEKNNLIRQRVDWCDLGPFLRAALINPDISVITEQEISMEEDFCKETEITRTP